MTRYSTSVIAGMVCITACTSIGGGRKALTATSPVGTSTTPAVVQPTDQQGLVNAAVNLSSIINFAAPLGFTTLMLWQSWLNRRTQAQLITALSDERQRSHDRELHRLAAAVQV